MNKHRQLIFAYGVELDAVDAADWYEEQKPGLGAEFADALDITLDLITHGAEHYQVVGTVQGKTVRRINLGRFPYSLLFRVVDDNLVRVLAIYHQHQRPRLDEEEL